MKYTEITGIKKENFISSLMRFYGLIQIQNSKRTLTNGQKTNKLQQKPSAIDMLVFQSNKEYHNCCGKIKYDDNKTSHIPNQSGQHNQ